MGAVTLSSVTVFAKIVTEKPVVLVIPFSVYDTVIVFVPTVELSKPVVFTLLVTSFVLLLLYAAVIFIPAELKL